MSLEHLLVGVAKARQMPLNDGLSGLAMTRFKQQLDVYHGGAMLRELTWANLARSISRLYKP